MGLRGWLAGRWRDAAAWAEGRAWPPRAFLLVVLAYFGWRHFTDPEYGSLFAGLTLGVHELGHLVFSPFGEWLATAGGSLMQVAAPVALAYGFLRQRDYYAIAVAGGRVLAVGRARVRRPLKGTGAAHSRQVPRRQDHPVHVVFRK